MDQIKYDLSLKYASSVDQRGVRALCGHALVQRQVTSPGAAATRTAPLLTAHVTATAGSILVGGPGRDRGREAAPPERRHIGTGDQTARSTTARHLHEKCYWLPA
jgi:hypothetical protein